MEYDGSNEYDFDNLNNGDDDENDEEEYDMKQDDDQMEEQKEDIDLYDYFLGKIHILNNAIDEGRMTTENYNIQLISLQTEIAEKKLENLRSKFKKQDFRLLFGRVESYFSELKESSREKGIKYNPTVIYNTIDDMFVNYGNALEDKNEAGFFESNPVTSDISNIINFPTPEKYRKEIQMFENKIENNNVYIDDIYAYLDLKLSVYNEKLETHLRNDIMYSRFYMDLQLLYLNIKSSMETLNETKKTDAIKENLNLLKEFDNKVQVIANQYKEVQDSNFKKEQSSEVLKMIKQLKNVYIKKNFKYERVFSDEEIIDDFKNKKMDFIITKYSKYVKSDYFEWANESDDKEETVIIDPRKKTSKKKYSQRELSFIRENEKKEYAEKRRIKGILRKIPEDILRECMENLVTQGLIEEPMYKQSAGERYINELYQKTIPILVFSPNYTGSMKEYANQVGRIMDEFMINRDLITAGWSMGTKIQMNDVVYIDRTNGAINTIMKRIKILEDELSSKIDLEGKINLTNDVYILRQKLKKYTDELSLINRGKHGKYMRKIQIKGTVVGMKNENNVKMLEIKVDGSKHIQKYPAVYASNYYGHRDNIPMYAVADSDTFNPVAPLKDTSLLPITVWIKAILGTKNSQLVKKNLTHLYNEALEKYTELDKETKNKLDDFVLDSISPRLRKEFVNGVPKIGPLIYLYPPRLPGIDKEDRGREEEINIDEFNEYVENMKTYVENLTPETNPYVKVGVPVPNKLIERIKSRVYPSLRIAVKHVPMNGFFKLSSFSDFESLILNFMNDTEKKAFQKSIMTQDELDEFNELYYSSEGTEDDTFNFQTTNPKITLIDDLDKNTDEAKYINAVGAINKRMKISKVVGDEVFLSGTEKPVTKKEMKKMLIQSLQSESGESKRILKKTDSLIPSIEWVLSKNMTFQLIELGKRTEGSYIVHTEPKFRIKIVNRFAQFYTGWTINPIKEVSNKYSISYEFKYPLIITDFTEFLKIYRNNLFLRYESFKKLSILNNDEFTSAEFILKQIRYINDYMKSIGAENNFDIEIIEQKDEHLKIRKLETDELISALRFISGNTIPTESIQKAAEEIEEEVYTLFEDIKYGTKKKDSDSDTTESPDSTKFDFNVSSVLRVTDSEFFNKIKKFKQTEMLKRHSINLLKEKGRYDYGLYVTQMAIAVFNIFHTNDFLKNYIEGKISIKSIINRDLSKEEVNEMMKGVSLDELKQWVPPTGILDKMKNEHPESYEAVIESNTGKIDISIFDRFEEVTKKKLSILNKKLALIELVKLNTWGDSLKRAKTIKKKKIKFMFLLKSKNALRSLNNISSVTRLDSLARIRYLIINKKQPSNEDREILDVYAENIENACYSLSLNQTEYKEIVSNVLSSETKMLKLISEFSSGSGPVDIVVNIAELYLGLISKSTKEAKLGSWKGVEGLPVELLQAIKKVSGSMIESRERAKKGNALIENNPDLGLQEYITQRDSQSGMYITKKIDIPLIGPENTKTNNDNMDIILRTIKNNFIHRMNSTLADKIQEIINKNNMTKNILNSIDNLDSKDIKKLMSFSYDELKELNHEIYREPYFFNVIPLSFAKEGVNAYPVEGLGFIVGGNLPLLARAYRYRDKNDKVKTKLTYLAKYIFRPDRPGEFLINDITEYNDVKKDIVYPDNMNIYSDKMYGNEEKILNKLKEILSKKPLFIKIYKNDLFNPPDTNIIKEVLKAFNMEKFIQESSTEWFKRYGGNRKLFHGGGTQQEYESFMENTYHREGMMRILGVYSLNEKKNIPSMLIDNKITVNILENGENTIFRKLFKSHTQKYPVPTGYNKENYPIYSKAQTPQLAKLLMEGHISPWYRSMIKIKKVNGNIIFSGEVPFIIDYNDNKTVSESYHYVEQIFKESLHGLPIITRIGIIPKIRKINEPITEIGPQLRTTGAVYKISPNPHTYIIKEEAYDIKYFMNKMPIQSQTNEMKIKSDQRSIIPSKDDISTKSGYSFIDPRMLYSTVKFKPDDVWTWNPLKDAGAGAQDDNEYWLSKKREQLQILNEWVKKAGSSSSAFIAAKTESTRFLQNLRLNLPSQKYGSLQSKRFRKPVKSGNDMALIKVVKEWAKFNKEKLINEAKRIGFYEEKMNKMSDEEILKLMKYKLEQSSKLNAFDILKKIGPTEVNTENLMKKYKETEECLTGIQYVKNFIENGFIAVSDNLMELIEDPTILFRHYNRYEIVFDEDGSITRIPKYDTIMDDKKRNDRTYETLYKIIKNMSYTTVLKFDENIVKYVENYSKFQELSKEVKMKIITNVPIMKTIVEIMNRHIDVTLWNILCVMYDTMYPVARKASKEQNKYKLKYVLEKPVKITMEDIISYLGDSYYQNAVYTKGIVYEMKPGNSEKESLYTGNILYLQPGGKYSKINPDEVVFTSKNSYVSKYDHNPYITLFRNIDEQKSKISIEMLIVGENLHEQNPSVSSSLARRRAMVYGVDMSEMDPCFNIANIVTEAGHRSTAIETEDVVKYLAKGGNYYTRLEMSDKELIARKQQEYMFDKQKVVNFYKSAVKEYFKSNDKQITYKDLINKKKLNPLSLNKYIDRVIEEDISDKNIGQFIDSMNIVPDFTDISWLDKKRANEQDFVNGVFMIIQGEGSMKEREKIRKDIISKNIDDILNNVLIFRRKYGDLIEDQEEREKINNVLALRRQGILANVEPEKKDKDKKKSKKSRNKELIDTLNNFEKYISTIVMPNELIKNIGELIEYIGEKVSETEDNEEAELLNKILESMEEYVQHISPIDDKNEAKIRDLLRKVLEGHKRSVEINIAKPSELLFKNNGSKIEIEKKRREALENRQIPKSYEEVVDMFPEGEQTELLEKLEKYYKKIDEYRNEPENEKYINELNDKIKSIFVTHIW